MRGNGFDFLYETREDDKTIFGDHFCGPELLEHGKDILIAKFQKDEGGDGQSTEVYCCALPARFYNIKVAAEPNSVGELQEAFELQTGSGAAKLARDIAEAIAGGMLGLRPANNGLQKTTRDGEEN